MASNIDKYTTPLEHSSIDHTGLPGVGVVGSSTVVGAVVIETAVPGVTASISKAIPANTLTADDQSLWVKWAGTTGSSGVPALTVDFDGQSIINDATSATGESVFVELYLVRTGVSTATASVWWHRGTGAAPQEAATVALTGLDWTVSNNVDVALTGGTGVAHTLYQALKWPEAGSLGLTGIGSDTLPTGTIVPYGGAISSVPAGFLPCDGSLADQTVEADLFGVIGTIWNIGGEPGGFFRLPDFRGKSLLGLNDGSLPAGIDGGFTARGLATLGGAEADTAPLPAHGHNIPGNMSNGSGSDLTRWAAGTTPDLSSQSSNDTDSAGAGGTHNTMHPFAVCAYIIKSQQVGGGIGLTGQNNGGALQGPRPTLNFIPSGGAGIAVVENVGQNRIDITISAPSGGISSTWSASGSWSFPSTGIALSNAGTVSFQLFFGIYTGGTDVTGTPPDLSIGTWVNGTGGERSIAIQTGAASSRQTAGSNVVLTPAAPPGGGGRYQKAGTNTVNVASGTTGDLTGFAMYLNSGY